MTTEPASTTEQATAYLNLLREQMPYNPRGRQAKGLLAPLFRAYGHITFLLATLTADHMLLTEEEAQNELNHAAAHLDAALIFTNNGLSDSAESYFSTTIRAITDARSQFHVWIPRERVSCITELSNRIAGFVAFLDREFTGITPEESDPGTSL